jgi:hypothetical protein
VRSKREEKHLRNLPMKWSEQLFVYCERGGDPSFWGEPLNAISNGGFIAASMAALFIRQQKPERSGDRAVLVLIGLVFVIGVGSFLFHTFATRWAMLADVAPIAIFMLAYIVFAIRRYLHAHWLMAVLAIAVFLLAGGLAGSLRCGSGPCLNGSLGYVPALAALLIVGGLLAVRRHPAAFGLLCAGAIFALSLTFRSVDQSLCAATLIQPNWRAGTHAVWHILNASVLFMLLLAAIKHGAASQRLR